MGRFLDVVRRVLQEKRFHELPARDPSFLRLQVKGHRGLYQITFREIPEDELLIMWVSPYILVPPERRKVVGELFLRVNARLNVGSLDIDLDDGNIAYRMGMDLTGMTPTEAMIWEAMVGSVVLLDEFLPAIGAVSFGEKEPQEALVEHHERKEEAQRGKSSPLSSQRSRKSQAVN